MEFIPIIEEILKENIVLIYAFNGTGKTRLSIDYKTYTKAANDGEPAGVYYNAYSEDLFQWDNDDENENVNIKLNIIGSVLNKYHSYIIEAPQKLQEYLDKYYVRYYFNLNYDKSDYYEKGIESVSFYMDEDKTKPIKISRGEERIFVWCFFLTLFEVSSFAEERNAHFFIDDPVSSLDEHNIHITASTIMDIISANYEKKKLIITTHHVGLFSILIDRLRKADGSEKFRKITKTYILGRNPGGEVALSKFGDDVFLFHLHLYKMIKDNILFARESGHLHSYNFVLLRQLLENIASFHGKSGVFSYALSKMGFENTPELVKLINEETHKDVYYYQSSLMSQTQRETFEDIVEKITTTYKFHI